MPAIDLSNAAVLTLGGVVFTTIISGTIALVSSRRSAYISAVTNERMKWISETKNLIQDYSGNIVTFVGKCQTVDLFYKNSEFVELLTKGEQFSTKLVLHLNPRGFMEKNVRTLLESIEHLKIECSKPNPPDKLLTELSIYQILFVEHAAWLMKAEWERVKIEASRIFYATYLRCKNKLMIYEYRTFCLSEGFFEPKRPDNLTKAREELRSRAPRLFLAKASTVGDQRH